MYLRVYPSWCTSVLSWLYLSAVPGCQQCCSCCPWVSTVLFLLSLLLFLAVMSLLLFLAVMSLLPVLTTLLSLLPVLTTLLSLLLFLTVSEPLLPSFLSYS